MDRKFKSSSVPRNVKNWYQCVIFSKCEIYVWSVSMIFGRKICDRISHFKADWYDFHKCEELVPNSLMSNVSRLNPHICEKWYQIVTCEKNLYKTLTCEELVPNLQTCEMLVPNYQRYEELVLNCHRWQWKN